MKTYQIPLQIKRNSRNAFTLVELMVAMALIILMLSIMSQAFVIATGVMQGLKEVADMQEKIRPAITLLQRDLGANHFEGSKKLSDPEFWDNGPPKEGYFMLWQDNAYDALETTPTDVVGFSRSAALANHMLAFTVKLPGKSPNDFFEENLALPIPAPIKLAFGNTFFNGAGTPQGMIDSNIRRFETTSDRVHSDWMEVAYFLGPHNAGVATPVADGNTDGKNNPPSLAYFNLYRQQKLVLPNYNIEGAALPLLDPNAGIISTPANPNPNLDINPNPSIGILLANDYFSGLSFHLDNNSKIEFNKPSDLTVPWKRMGNRTFNGLTANQYLGKPQTNKPLFSEYSSATKVNTDIIATNVISFDVKLLTDDQYDYETLNAILNRAPYSLNLNPAFGNYSPSLVFDTWTTDQGNAVNSIPKYDLGEWNTIPNKWQPSISASSATIPVWGWKVDTTVTPNVNKPYKGLNIKAVQISLRIWDQKSNTAKMFVVVQKL
jgi:type II secretory pathway pseudopilin PulG